MRRTRRWPESSGTWTPLQQRRTVIVTPRPLDVVDDVDTLVVTTPLDLIARLEVDQLPIDMIVLSGQFAADRALCNFLRETYPEIAISLR
jgi:hypothetical protein